MAAPEKITDLIKRFKDNQEAYRSSSYNETQARRELIDPFFKALGWDIDNEAGYAEGYKDVVHEDATKVGGVTRAPDYAFRIGGTRKFFVEAKRPGVNIKENTEAAYQLRRYGWSAKLPLSIVTDFEEFAVYDCRIKPSKNDKASVARVMYITYQEYLDKWEEIASIFSPEAIRKGSFDKYAQSKKKKHGTAEVDDAFLEEIENWRDVLARNIAPRNKTLSNHEVNFAVQRTIDRIIFLRICEDRGIEKYGQLMGLQNGANVYQRLCQIFRRADERYNSGLFHFQKEKNRRDAPDELTLNLKIDDKVLKGILKDLYYPESPYEFSVLPADILGHIYEQFLGKVIRLTPAHHAKVEDKPEVKKAGGVYYTPTYIVDYIVEHTVGKLLKRKTPTKVSKLRILDPACGSGSFLLGAYQTLLDWHLQWYQKHDAEKHAKGSKPKIYHGPGGDWRLTTSEKKRILLNNIYGVDIDPQAVEVTKLSLLLKVLEGENEETLGKTYKLFHERALPDLGDNIKCGNSLIGPDFYEGKQLSLIDEEERYRINAFDWNAEFPDIFPSPAGRGKGEGNSGFDAVIGNPPYVRQEALKDSKEYFKKSFSAYNGVADLYVYFIEKGISLLRAGGLFSYIVANKWLRANYGKAMRQWLKKQHIVEIVDFGDQPVFSQATTYPCIIVIQNKQPAATFSSTVIKNLDFSDLSSYVQQHRYEVQQEALDDAGWSLLDQGSQALLSKLRRSGIPLGQYVDREIYYGIKTGLNEAFVIDAATRRKLIQEDPRSEEVIKPFLAGRDIKRYEPLKPQRYLLFTRRGTDIREYPAVKNHLWQFKEKLMPRPKAWQGGKWPGRKPGAYQWYEIQDTIDYYAEFEKPKIIVPAIVRCASYAFDTSGFYSNDKTTIIPTSDKYLLGLISSKLIDFYMHSISSTKRGGYFEYKPMYISKLPIRTIDLSDSSEQEDHNRIVALVETMLRLHKDLQTAKTDHEKSLIQRQIDTTDKEIDNLVYELYDLTDEEIRIVEEVTK